MSNNRVLDKYVELHQKLLVDSREALIDRIIQQCDWKTVASSPLSQPIPLEELKKNAKAKLRELLGTKSDEKRIEEGMKIISENLHHSPHEKHCIADLTEALKRILNYYQLAIENREKIFSFISQHASELSDEALIQDNDQDMEIPSLAKELGISTETLAAFYEIGSKLFDEGKFDQASRVFFLLSYLNPYTFEIWLSLGMSMHKLDNWGSAIHAYSMASIMKPDKAISHVYCAECFLAIHDWEDAKESLDIAQRILTKEDGPALQAKINTLKKIV